MERIADTMKNGAKVCSKISLAIWLCIGWYEAIQGAEPTSPQENQFVAGVDIVMERIYDAYLYHKDISIRLGWKHFARVVFNGGKVVIKSGEKTYECIAPWQVSVYTKQVWYILNNEYYAPDIYCRHVGKWFPAQIVTSQQDLKKPALMALK
jgi:hypothetical protein